MNTFLFERFFLIGRESNSYSSNLLLEDRDGNCVIRTPFAFGPLKMFNILMNVVDKNGKEVFPITRNARAKQYVFQSESLNRSVLPLISKEIVHKS